MNWIVLVRAAGLFVALLVLALTMGALIAKCTSGRHPGVSIATLGAAGVGFVAVFGRFFSDLRILCGGEDKP